MPHKIDLSFTLETDPDLIMRIPTVEQAPVIFSAVDQSRTHLKSFLGWVDSSQTVQDTEAFLASCLEESMGLKGLTLGIWHQGEFVGLIGLHQIDFPNRSTTMGYWLVEAYQGRGFMTLTRPALHSIHFR